MHPLKDDAVVIGAGCIGASTAKHLAEAGHSVTVLEKEPRPAMHQSGRNSGVIHAGYNLEPGSQKARFCVDGSRQMRAYCRDRGVAVVQGGILVVATAEAQVPELDRLQGYAKRNGVEVARLDGEAARDVEPEVACMDALHAPTGASVDSTGYVEALVADAQTAGASFRYGVNVHGIHGATAKTDHGDVRAKVLINAAGLHADRVAGDVCQDMRVVPFRGDYAGLRPAAARRVRSHIYAAPDPRFPFLGVHLSRRFDDTVTAGPGAMLAFGREAYRFWKVQPRDLAATLSWPGFWRSLRGGLMARLPSEVHKSLRLKAIWKEAQQLVPALRPGDLERGMAGNRAQLVDRDGRLVDDIVVRETDDAVHVLNAVSPGLTCSLPFGAYVADLAAARS